MSGQNAQAPVDVLAVMDLISDCDFIPVKAEHLAEVRAALAELIEADKEYDSARADIDDAERALGAFSVKRLRHDHPAVLAMRRAFERRQAALARVGGVS